MNKPIVSINNLNYLNIYKNFNLLIPSNLNFAITGENGTGKTTLIKLICGLLKPEKGSIVFESLTTNHKSLPAIGYCSQHTVWPSNIKVEHLLELFAQTHHFTYLQMSNNTLFNDLMINTITHLQLHHLSGGQNRRLALFLALFYNPNIVCLDEPFSNIDQRKNTIQILKKYCKEHNIQIILISHSVYEISQLTQIGIFLTKDSKRTNIYTTKQLSKILIEQFIN